MSGGFRLLSALALLLPMVAAFSADESSSTKSPAPNRPPKVKVEVVEDTSMGTKSPTPIAGWKRPTAPIPRLTYVRS